MHDYKTYIKKISRRYKKIPTKNKLRAAASICLIALVVGIMTLKEHAALNGAVSNAAGKYEAKEYKKEDKNNKGITIVVDPGHGKKADMTMEFVGPNTKIRRAKSPVGAVGSFSKTPEYQINLEVAMKLKAILEEKGFNVVMTKTTLEENPAGSERAEIGNRANARIAVRIHADSYKDSSARGTTILVPAPIDDEMKKISEESYRIGNIIMEKLIENAGVKSREVSTRKDLTTFNWSKVPTMIIEMGFLSNKEEDMLLNNDEHQNKLAKGIAEGIWEALKDEIENK